eukprot:461547_1
MKKSRHIGVLRKRWTVLTIDYLCTYKQKEHIKSTESIKLSTITSIESLHDENSFVIKSNVNNSLFCFFTENKIEKQQWINTITAYINLMQVPVTVVCDNNQSYSCNFTLPVPYYLQYDYTIHCIIKNIINLMNQKHNPARFVLKQINKDSFIQEKMRDVDCDWQNLNAYITDYMQYNIMQKGLNLLLDIEIYKHNIQSLNITCPHMVNNDINECPIYSEMRDKYVYSKQNLNHIMNHCHFRDEYVQKPECIYNSECYAFKRLQNGGNKTSDLCHINLFSHPPRNKTLTLASDVHPFSLNEEWCDNVPLYDPDDYDQNEYGYNEKDGYLNALIKEIIDNGYETDLSVTDDADTLHSILNIVDDKLNSVRHIKMGSPLNKAEMLSIILYTGCDCNYDLCKSQRNGNYKKWKWFD